MDIEQQKIEHSINIFSEWMSKRMMKKKSEGFTGWQTPNDFNVKERLLEKAQLIVDGSEDDKDIVDVSNFAMMLFMENWEKVFPFVPDESA
jgi:hypothetical protein